ncbi:tetratricopeptide repeat protein [Streptomyces sp. NPDC015220]|uniref:tetratricopeptide repeat protein n=1 Tax=Streptomyces sp. NPDC015220 TaxID=3364947 RepID=UPI0037020419
MEKRPRSPATSLMTAPGRRSRPVLRVFAGLLVAAVCGLGTVSLLTPDPRRAEKPPAPSAPGAAGALGAVTAGTPASLPGLAELIADRERLLRGRPGDARTWAVLGAAYVERGRRTADAADFPKADRALRTSLRLRPEGNTDALDGLAALADQRRDFRTARSRGEAALKLEPKRWTTYPLLIDAYDGLGDYRAARRTLDGLLKLRRSPAVRARAAAVYWDRGWREDAAAQLSDAAAAATAPAERAAYLERAGRIAWQRGDLDDALRHFEAALRLDPDQRDAAAGRARTLASLGRTEEARAAYRQALGSRPRPEVLLELGELYESLGRLGEAAEQYGLVRARVRQDAAAGVDGELVLGRLEADHGDARSAVRRLRSEWRRQAGIAVADALGWALHRAGEDQEALRFATTATDGAKGGGVRDALYAYHRGVIEQSLDETGVARRHLELALRTNPAFSPLWAPRARRALDELAEPSMDDAPEEVETEAEPPAQPVAAQVAPVPPAGGGAARPPVGGPPAGGPPRAPSGRVPAGPGAPGRGGTAGGPAGGSAARTGVGGSGARAPGPAGTRSPR